MDNRFFAFEEGDNSESPHPIGEILAELLDHYQIRFPNARITLVESPVTT